MTIKNSKKVVVGLSGGVDSSVALLLLKSQGLFPIGLTLQLPVWECPRNLKDKKDFCTTEGVESARELCQKLDVPYYVLDCQKEFKKIVVDYFVRAYKEDKTPNPCMICNKCLRFPKFFEFAKKQGAEFVATGHYARLRREKPHTTYHIPQTNLLEAKDKSKDQSYFLAFLNQRMLSKLLFPIGDYTKAQVYEIAKKGSLEHLEQRPSSRDFCFVTRDLKDDFLKEQIGGNPGPILDKSGKVLGKHQGLHFYTLGQRRKIGFSGGPFWVVGFDREKNALIVSKDEEDLFKREFFVKDIHWISGESPRFPLKAKARIRLRHTAAPALIEKEKADFLKVTFRQPQRAITPGQFAVFYLPAEALAKEGKNNVCLGGGEIVS